MLPPDGDDWVALCSGPVPLDQLATWPVVACCGASVLFTGTVRDDGSERPGVTYLEYEAYERAALHEMETVVAELRRRWPAVGRVALVHASGRLAPTEAAVAVAVSAPHRGEAFEAARFAIDAVKSRAPIWKSETRAGDRHWVAGRALSGLAGTSPDPGPVSLTGLPSLAESC